MSGEMTSNRPYLLRALYEWIGDNGMTPHVLVDADMEGVDVPEHSIQKGKVILNIDPAAVRDLHLGNEWLTFNARFAGRSCDVVVPIDAVLAIYCKENGQGMMFAQEEPSDDPDGSDDTSGPEKRPHLEIVK